MFFKRKKRPWTGILLCSIIFLMFMINCKNTTTPDDTNATARVTVSNECGIAVDIYLDKNFQFSVDYQQTRTIADISLGEHEFESKKQGTEILLSYLSVEITEGLDFVWTLQSEASLHVTNAYGETLDIYGDGDLLSDIGALGTLIIENILYGERVFKALRQSDGAEIESLTIDITENIPYFWTIEK